MINKIYVKTINYFKTKFLFYISLCIVFIFLTFPLPYYINAPGGLINLNTKVIIDNAYTSKGSLNMAYVREINATLPTIIYSLLSKDWTIIRKDKVIPSNEKEEDVSFRDHLLLDEAIDNAIILGFQKANEYVNITKRDLYITYVDKDSLTDLKVGDKVLEIDNRKITNKNELYDILKTKKENDLVSILVEKGDKKILKKATMINSNDKIIIGIMISEKKEYDLNKDVKLKFTKSESGPSGGLMTALSIYDYLTEIDITKGKKIVGTGTIDTYGNVGSIGGITYKIKGAVKKKADIFLVPKGENYDEALKLVKKQKYKITLVPISTFDEALTYLETLD